jgi:hypothetical protein
MSYLPDLYKVRSGPGVSGVSAAAGQKNGWSNRIKNLTKCNFIFLTGSTGWTGYSYTKTK